MHGVDDRRLDHAAEHRAERTGVVVDDVEVVRTLEARERMAELDLGVADLLRRCLVVDGDELGLRARVPGGEERHLMPGADESLGEKRDDPLDPAVARRRHREPDRAENGDLHSAASTSMCPFSSRTSQLRSNARTPESLSEPSQEGNSAGASDTTACLAGSGRRPRRSWSRSTGVPAAHACGRAAVG